MMDPWKVGMVVFERGTCVETESEAVSKVHVGRTCALFEITPSIRRMNSTTKDSAQFVTNLSSHINKPICGMASKFILLCFLLQTYTGSILVAVNPYKMYDMYGLDMVKKYEGQILGTLPP